MSRHSNADHYVDPETGVLRNRLGITSETELEKAEADFAGTRSYELGKNSRLSFFISAFYLFENLTDASQKQVALCGEHGLSAGKPAYRQDQSIIGL